MPGVEPDRQGNHVLPARLTVDAAKMYPTSLDIRLALPTAEVREAEFQFDPHAVLEGLALVVTHRQQQQGLDHHQPSDAHDGTERVRCCRMSTLTYAALCGRILRR